MYYVYILINDINNLVYVGSSKNLIRRFKTHISNLKYNKHSSKRLQKVYNDGADFDLLCCEEFETEQESRDFELKLMKRLGYENILNDRICASGGDYISNHPNIEEIKIKRNITKSNNNNINKPDVFGVNNPNYKHGKYIKDSKKCLDCGSIISSNATRCRECVKIYLSSIRSGNLNSFYGKTHSDEVRQHLSRINKGKVNKSQCKKVYAEGNIYMSLAECARSLGKNPSTILNRIRRDSFKDYYYLNQ